MATQADAHACMAGCYILALLFQPGGGEYEMRVGQRISRSVPNGAR